MKLPESVEGVCEITVHRAAAGGGKWLLVEIPHGATRLSEYEAVRRRLQSALPEQLEHFFFVNTDIGAPEGAALLGSALSAQGLSVLVARCLIPRTFIDTNRVLAKTQPGVMVDGLTPAVPGYISSPEDAAWLTALHGRYHQVVSKAYEACLATGGVALQLHSYAPRSVAIERTDAGIVKALHSAYLPEMYEKWPQRPAVDVICATADGSFKSAPGLVERLLEAYRAFGIDAEKNATYHLHPVAMGLAYARAYPEQVLCVELNRGLLADPFVPFGPSPISEERVMKMVSPIARMVAAALTS